ncbi:hypothetical protein DKM44_02400 [Deinococcus irradiatisoli]|uniref:Uncharacterized protein n=1 Tax=Deinococcus irradiatisoli TaxID=2202254 RepID=A0A2Z3JAU0_9DEIO|nr:hypothetical protein [Deinococcus irradiatisoli]AWN22227.1 hypothetical protein DKM44_02400 [Deinococcus irradiatisoli]
MKLFRLLEAELKWFLALALLWSGYAFAQDATFVLGPYRVPDWAVALLAAFVGWLAKEINSPLTALLKQKFGFEGNVTRWVYFVLSLIFTAILGAVSGAFGQGQAGWAAAGVLLVTTLIKGFGDYLKLKQAAAAATSTPVPVETPSAVPAPTLLGDHVIYPKGTPGTEPLIHNGKVIGAVRPLTGGLK